MARKALVSKFCDGFVLTGGRSSRMGQDKALLEVDGTPLIRIVAANVQRALGEVTLVGSKVKYEKRFNSGEVAQASACATCGIFRSSRRLPYGSW